MREDSRRKLKGKEEKGEKGKGKKKKESPWYQWTTLVPGTLLLLPENK